jgi:hypothetical protein
MELPALLNGFLNRQHSIVLSNGHGRVQMNSIFSIAYWLLGDAVR